MELSTTYHAFFLLGWIHLGFETGNICIRRQCNDRISSYSAGLFGVFFILFLTGKYPSSIPPAIFKILNKKTYDNV